MRLRFEMFLELEDCKAVKRQLGDQRELQCVCSGPLVLVSVLVL